MRVIIQTEALRRCNDSPDKLCFIHSLPTIDAVPVVRCRECKEYEPDCGYCDYWETSRREDDYCSRGAKMYAQPEPSRGCATCANDGMDMPQCRECVEQPGYPWYRPKEE